MPDAARHHEYLIDSIWPKRQIHLIGGPSGAGKTTLTFQILEDLAAGRDVFGHKSSPESLLYIATDRDDEETARTMDRMHIKPSFPCIGMSDKPEWSKRAERENKPEYVIVLEEIQKAYPQCKTIIWDGFSFMVDGDQNKNSDVSKFLRRIHAYIKRQNMTIIGIVNAAKQREDNKILNPRQRISGAAAWAHICNCIFIIEPATPEHPEDSTRNVWVCPRNQRDTKFQMIFTDEGLLAFVDEEEKAQEQGAHLTAARNFCASATPGSVFTRRYLVETLDIPEGSVGRILKSLAKDGTLLKGDHGQYRVPNPS